MFKGRGSINLMPNVLESIAYILHLMTPDGFFIYIVSTNAPFKFTDWYYAMIIHIPSSFHILGNIICKGSNDVNLVPG